MPFQSTVKYDYGFGVVGEVVRDGPIRSKPALLVSANAANNVFGRAFTQPAAGGAAAAGGTGVYAGILVHPKQHASFGGALGPLSPSFALPNNTIADLMTMGLVVAMLTTAATIGQQVQMSQADGTLSIPAVPGTADSGHTMIPAWVDRYPQPTANDLVLLRLTEQ
jgi:mRNA-degrading endonuclease toxin of MazEF toxin-antitoxin module